MDRRRHKGPKERHHEETVQKTAISRSGPRTFDPSRPETRELLLLAVVFSVGVVLRLVALSHSAVEHFDEGVYASNIYFPPPEFTYPQQKYYAPPLLPALIEAGMIAGLAPNLAALLPSFLAGCATVVALWWLGRSWFGERVGIAAATLAALSPFHIAYSAAALTDVLLGLWLVLALDAAARSLRRGDLRWAVGAGLYTGLAWWTKYNGWLPLAVEAAALPVLLLTASHQRIRGQGTGDGGQGAGIAGRWLICLVTTCAVAAGLWAPYFWSLQKEGGYAPIAANHARYVVGFAGWFNSASRQIASFSVMEGYWTAAAIVAGLLLVAVVGADRRSDSDGPDSPQRRTPLMELSLAGLTIAVMSTLNAPLLNLAVFSLLGLVGLFSRILRNSRESAGYATVGAALAAAWWGGLFVATPCYWPYPRLLLPWLIVAWLGTALFLDEMVRGCFACKRPATTGSSRARPWLLTGVVLLGLLAVLPVSRLCRPAPPVARSLNDNRLSFQKIALQMRADLDRATSAEGKSDPRVVYVLGEPAMLFQLFAVGEPIVRPAQGVVASSAKLEGRDLPTFLVVGPQSKRSAAFADQWSAAGSHWRLVASYDDQPSAIVWLDLDDPRAAPQQPEHALRLYQFQP